MSAQVQPRITPAQYLDLEENSPETRHEYYNGRMYAMSGGTLRHALIIGRLLTELNNALQGKPCSVVSGHLRIRVTPEGLYTYPDIAVVCGQPELALGGGETLLNPVLLGEVLSASTEAYDRGFKAAQYRKLSSLKEYVLVSQVEPRVEVVRRGDDGSWHILDYAGIDAVCHLASVACDVPLARIYRGLAFGEPAAGVEHPAG